MLRIKDLRLPLSTVYITVGITTYLVTLGGLLLTRPDFAQSQSSTVSSNQQEPLLEVRTASSKNVTASNDDRSAPSQPSPSVTPLPSTYKQQTRDTDTSSTVVSWQPTATATPRPTPTPSVSTTPQPTAAAIEPTTTPQPTDTPEPQNTDDNPSLIGGLLDIVDVIL
jgi:hypothetical protein